MRQSAFEKRQEAFEREVRDRESFLSAALLSLMRGRVKKGEFESKLTELAASFAEVRIGQDASIGVRALLNTKVEEPLLSKLGLATAERIVRLSPRRRAQWESTLRFALPPAGKPPTILASSVAARMDEARAGLEAGKLDQEIGSASAPKKMSAL